MLKYKFLLAPPTPLPPSTYYKYSRKISVQMESQTTIMMKNGMPEKRESIQQIYNLVVAY
jgi:hypothetical protein